MPPSVTSRPRRGRTARRLSAVLVALALGLVTACGSGAAGGASVDTVPTAAPGQDPLAPRPLAEPQTVRIGLSSKLEVYLPVLLAQELGEFEKENVRVEVEYMPPTDSPLLLAQGRLDIVYAGYTAGILNLMSANDRIRFAYPGGTVSSPQQGVYLRHPDFPALDALTAADFRGKKIMTSSGSASSTAYFLWERATRLPGGADLKPTDIDFEASTLPEVPLVITSGAASGGQVISPYHTTLVGDACCEVFPGAYPSAPQTGYLVGPSLAERKDVAAAVFRAMARTEKQHLQGDYHADRALMETAAKVMDQDVAVISRGEPTVFAPDLDTNSEVFPALQRFFRDFGDLSYPEDLPVDRIYDLDYVRSLGSRV